jgi:hypothetical protein
MPVLRPRLSRPFFYVIILQSTHCEPMKSVWKEAAGTNLRFYPGTCLEGLRKTTKTSVSGPDLNRPGTKRES